MDFFAAGDLVFEREELEHKAFVVRENPELYHVRPARSHLE